MKYANVAKYLLRTLAITLIVLLVTAIIYETHGKALTAGLIDLVLVMLIAFRWGFVEAVIATVLAGACLDYFYMVPIFSLYEHEPQDWISSAVFMIIAMTAGHFADRIKQKAARTECERTRLEKLYLASRDIIMLDQREAIGPQLTSLIVETFTVDAVALWDARETRMDKAGDDIISDDEVRAIYFHELCENDLVAHKFKRVLRLGTKSVGALCVDAPSLEGGLDSRSVDAIASLSAIALERAHSFAAETNAEAARRSEQLRSTVLDGLAHAFKTPLATIESASSGLLEMNRLEYPERQLVSLIDREAARLAKLTNQVLRTAEVDEGQLKVDHERICLVELFRFCRNEAAHLLADHPLRIIDETSGAHIWADARLLQMALLQVLDNASKYASPASAVTLCASLTNREVLLSVQNEGSFIPPEERLRIFQRFYRSPGSQHKASGTGIGLSVTKRIAEVHSGRVWVESDAEAGTTFFLALPHAGKEA